MAEKYDIWDNERIRSAREVAAITRDKAASELQIHPTYLAMIENDKRQPGPSLIARMSSLYSQPMAYFLKTEKNLVEA